jgi:hypothetical protein
MLALGQIGDCDNEPIDADDPQVRARRPASVVKDQQTKFFSMIAAAQIGGRPGNGDEPLAGMTEVRKYLSTALDKSRAAADRSWAGLDRRDGTRARGQPAKSSQLSPTCASRSPSAMAETGSPQEIGAFGISMGLMRDVESRNVLRAEVRQGLRRGAKGYCAVGLGLMNDRESIKPIQEVIQESSTRPTCCARRRSGWACSATRASCPTS